MSKPHFLLVTFPAQGHINPTLQLARRLTRDGALVTFVATVSSYRRMISKPSAPAGLSFASFSDGFDDGFKPSLSSPQSNGNMYMSEMKRRGTEMLTRVIEENRSLGRPFTFVVFTPLLSWVSKVAREFQLPVAILWIQPAIVFDVYYYYFNGYADVIKDTAEKHPTSSIKFPGLPPLHLRDLPSFVVPSNSYAFLLPAFQEQIESLNEETNPTILVNTFGELEPEALNLIPNFKMVPIGPLINKPQNDSSGVDDDNDQSRDQKNYIEWLETKSDSSVVYISFGTVAVLSKKQLEEISRGLIESRRPFLWVITDKSYRSEGEGEKEEDNLASFREELDELGMVVSWCDQIRVLGHRAIGCFVTHCGWNSTLECLVVGVPMVAFPQWADQTTNAMLVEECWRTGPRVKENEEGVVESGEIRRCIEAVMAEEAETTEEFRRNVAKWRDLAAEAVQEGGSSYNNLKAIVDEHI